MNTVPKMYVLVRKDLEATYRIIQGSHAIVEYSFLENVQAQAFYRAWRNSTVIFLGVRNEQALEFWEFKLQSKGKIYAAWKEPDLKGQLTAIACIDTGEVFKGLNLAG
jgi:hypothetical protein